MIEVSAEWVNESFTSLRVLLPGGSTHRITYTLVNENNATEPKMVTTNSISHVVKDFRPDWFYTILVEAVSLESGKAMNGSIGIGEQFHVLLFTCIEFFLSVLLVQLHIFSFGVKDWLLLLLLVSYLYY